MASEWYSKSTAQNILPKVSLHTLVLATHIMTSASSMKSSSDIAPS